jgi:ribosome modulation factor
MMSEARVQGYRDYYNGKGSEECPYDYYTERQAWEGWCDGHMEAYCEDEGK